MLSHGHVRPVSPWAVILWREVTGWVPQFEPDEPTSQSVEVVGADLDVAADVKPPC
jgi:hypothetical protein